MIIIFFIKNIEKQFFSPFYDPFFILYANYVAFYSCRDGAYQHEFDIHMSGVRSA